MELEDCLLGPSYFLFSYLVSYQKKNESKNESIFKRIVQIFDILYLKYGKEHVWGFLLEEEKTCPRARAMLTLTQIFVGKSQTETETVAFSSFFKEVSLIFKENPDFSTSRFKILISGTYRSQDNEINEKVEDLQYYLSKLIR